jgi:hypothetical protein
MRAKDFVAMDDDILERSVRHDAMKTNFLQTAKPEAREIFSFL